jgi:hypothetical protein
MYSECIVLPVGSSTLYNHCDAVRQRAVLMHVSRISYLESEAAGVRMLRDVCAMVEAYFCILVESGGKRGMTASIPTESLDRRSLCNNGMRRMFHRQVRLLGGTSQAPSIARCIKRP